MKKLIIFMCFILAYGYAVEVGESSEVGESPESNAIVSDSPESSESNLQDSPKSSAMSSKSNDSPKSKIPIDSSVNRNAPFAGIELGYTRFEYKENGVVSTNSLINPLTNGVFNIGIFVGYRYFFSESIGIRGYANMNYVYDKKGDFGELKWLNLGINADFLLNFYTSQNFDFGALLGLSFGGDIFSGNGVRRIKESIDDYSANLSSPSVSVNLGIQSVVINKIGIEFVAKIPLMSHYFLNAGDGKLNSITRQFSQDYSLNARVVWQF